MIKDVKLVVKRNIQDFMSVEEAVNDMIKERFSMDEYLANMSQLLDPFLFKDMQIAVETLTEAFKKGTNICIYGDYDVDGTTSVYTGYNLLLKLAVALNSKSKIGYYIPHREREGYGVNNGAIDRIKSAGYDFIITVDCGISCYPQVEYAKSLDMTVVVTDHHEYPKQIPQCPIINPHDGVYPFHKLSGCGVLFKYMEAMFKYNNLPISVVYEYLDVVSISTVADLVELTGENRIIVKYGLYLMQNNYDKRVRPWLNALLDAANFKGMIDSYTIGFVIGPRINSVGRLNHSMQTIKFMLTKDENELARMAQIINDLNEERKKLQDNIVIEGDNIIKSSPNGLQNSINIVVDGRVGVVGLAASHLLEKYYRPTTVFSSSVHPEIYKASARSIEDFDYFNEVLEQTRDIIVGGGGHAAAAGLSVRKENIEEFNNRVNLAVEKALKTRPDLLMRKIHVDCELLPESIDMALVNKVDQMAPFGMGNATPLFLLKNMTISSIKGVPSDNPKHIQMTLMNGERVFKAILFKRYDLYERLQSLHTIDIVFSLSLNRSFGKTEINFLINYFRPSILNELED